ncbi:hypothetical protein NMY22_g320 [Coprinellus aureogranulatus]|nr:hypothetical protein NMY22_g320 [Coprinellus aureogranulatus]
MSVFWLLPKIKYPLKEEIASSVFNRVAYIVGLLILVVLTIVNVAIVGYEPTTVFRSNFNDTQSFWFHKFSPPPKPGTLCEPRILNEGDYLFTNMSIFEWKIIAITQPSAGKSSFAYNGTTLDSCDIDQINFHGELHTRTIQLAAYASCRGQDGVIVVSETSFTFSLLPGRQGRYHRSAQYTATDPVNGYLTEMAGLGLRDASTRSWKAFVAANRTGHVALSFTTKVEFCPVPIGVQSKEQSRCAVDPPHFNVTDMKFVDANMDSVPDAFSERPSGTLLEDDVLARPITNLLHFYLASFRVDLGNPSSNNILTHPEALNRTLYAEFPSTDLTPGAPSLLYDYLQQQSLLFHSGSESAFDAFRIPGPSVLQTAYICTFLKRKSPANLIVSVFVATAGMFTSGWALFISVARYLHRSQEPREKLGE